MGFHLGRRVAAVAAVGAIALSAASATSLGSLSPPSLEAKAVAPGVCEASGTLLDTLGVPIPIGPTLTGVTVGAVTVTGVAPECVGWVPTVIVIGFTLPAGPSEELLTEIPLPPVTTSPTETLVPSGPVLLPSPSIVTEVRVALSPD